MEKNTRLKRKKKKIKTNNHTIKNRHGYDSR